MRHAWRAVRHTPMLQGPHGAVAFVRRARRGYNTWAVTVTNLSQASLGRPSPRALKPRLRYKLNHGVVGGVYYNLYTRGARPGRVVCLRCSCEYVGRALARLAPPSGRAASRAWSRVARRVGGR